MNMVRSVLRLLALGALAMIMAIGARAQQTLDRPLEQTYRAIQPQPVETGDRIEVIDFFWYGCPFCYQLLPVMSEWEKRKSAEITVRRIPAVLRESWLADAHLYYTLELLGEADRLHAQVFDSVHKGQLQTGNPEAVAAWAAKNGIAAQKWQTAYTDNEVRNRVVRAMTLARNYDVRGTPAVIVDGRYQTSSGMAGGLMSIPVVLDALVDLARERRKKQP